MTQNTGELQALERRMIDLVKARDEIIVAAEAMIEQANREFDEAAVPLGRAINRERAVLQPKTGPSPVEKARAKSRAKKLPAMDGLTDEEKAMYKQLLTGSRK